MSFILEAQKRDAANIDPDVAAQLAVEAHRASRWRWIWLGIGAAVLANVLIIGYFFNPFGKDAGASRSNDNLSTPNSARELVVRPRERTGPTRPQQSLPPATATRPTPQPAARPSTPPPVPASVTSIPGPAPSGRGRVLTPEQAAALNIGLPDQPAEANVPAPAFETASAKPTAEPEPATASENKVLTLADLSAADRADFPKLEFSTHIFADDPELRAVVVNSKRLAEGESIGEMVLRAVTEDGILVDYRGKRVAVSVVETWN